MFVGVDGDEHQHVAEVTTFDRFADREAAVDVAVGRPRRELRRGRVRWRRARQRVGHDRALGSEQGAAVGLGDGDREHVVTGQRIVHALGQRRQVGRRSRLGQDVPDQRELAVQLVTIELDEMSIDRTGHEVADREQHHRRGDREVERQAKGDRSAPHHALPGVSST